MARYLATGKTVIQPASPVALGRRVYGKKWQDAPHLSLVNDILVDVANGTGRRVIIQMPPRHGKSTLVSELFPPWFIGVNPDKRVILATHTGHFAKKWGKKGRDILTSYGSKLFGVELDSGSCSADQWDIAGSRGGLVARGLGGAITGEGADVLVVDDLVKDAEVALSAKQLENAWEWFHSTASERLEPGGSIIVMFTRWAQQDLIGRLQEEQPDIWETISLPAISMGSGDALGRPVGEALWPDRFPISELEKIRDSKPEYWWQAKYQQSPGHHQSFLWPPEYFEGDIWFDEWPKDGRLRTMALDASKGVGSKHGDYSAYCMMQIDQHGHMWVDAWMSNITPVVDTVVAGVRRYNEFRPDGFGVEINNFQELLLPMFREAFAAPPPIIGIQNNVNKRVRIERLDEFLKNRIVKFRRTGGGELLVKQLREYGPTGNHDDGPDAMEMALRVALQIAHGKTERNMGSLVRS